MDQSGTGAVCHIWDFLSGVVVEDDDVLSSWGCEGLHTSLESKKKNKALYNDTLRWNTILNWNLFQISYKNS